MSNETTLPPDFLDGLRHAADEDEGAGHTLQADYMRKAADEIERLSCDTARAARPRHRPLTTTSPTQPPSIVERLRELAQAVIDARQRFAQFEAYIDEVNGADEKMANYILNKMVPPDFTAIAAVCACAADFLRDFDALPAVGGSIGASRHSLAEALASLPHEEVTTDER